MHLVLRGLYSQGSHKPGKSVSHFCGKKRVQALDKATWQKLFLGVQRRKLLSSITFAREQMVFFLPCFHDSITKTLLSTWNGLMLNTLSLCIASCEVLETECCRASISVSRRVNTCNWIWSSQATNYQLQFKKITKISHYDLQPETSKLVFSVWG